MTAECKIEIGIVYNAKLISQNKHPYKYNVWKLKISWKYNNCFN